MENLDLMHAKQIQIPFLQKGCEEQKNDFRISLYILWNVNKIKRYWVKTEHF